MHWMHTLRARADACRSASVIKTIISCRIEGDYYEN